MTSIRAKLFAARLALLSAALAALAVAAPAGADAAEQERFRVCSITINSDDEIRTFRKRLPESRFEFVELTRPGADEPAAGEPAWFAEACARGVRCDVLVVSGHFSDPYAGSSGTTFVGETKLSLALEALESRRCDQTCPGLLGAPLEVFLLGCRTLATGLESRPLPKGDVALLERLGVTPRTADEILEEIRYRGEETSNRRRMRFAFAGVPHVFGFTWTSPTGEHLAPALDRYLRATGDYARHLERIARGRASGTAASPNRALARALRSTTFAEARGFSPADAELRHDTGSCFLRNDRNTPAARIERIEALLAGPGFLAHLAAVSDFLRRMDPATLGPAEKAALERIRSSEEHRRRAGELIAGLESPVLRLEVARVARALGWVTEEESLRVHRETVLRMLRPPTYGEGRDVVCGMDRAVLDALDVRASEVPEKLYEDEFGLQALACLRPRDPEIHARLASSLSDPREWVAQRAAAALAAAKASDSRVQLELVRQLERPEPGVRSSAAEALRAIAPTDPAVVSAIRTADPSFTASAR